MASDDFTLDKDALKTYFKCSEQECRIVSVQLMYDEVLIVNFSYWSTLTWMVTERLTRMSLSVQ